MKRLLATLVSIVILLGIGDIATGDTLVYDNDWGTAYGFVFGNYGETADLITLAGTERSVTQVNILVYLIPPSTGFAGGTADTQVRLYTDNGLPNTLLWDSGLLDDYFYSPGNNSVLLSLPGVVVPNTFWWSIEISDTSISDYLNLSVNINPPTIGSSVDTIAINNNPWQLLNFGADPIANFAAQIYAEPVLEPATMLLLGTGLVGVAGAARRRKKNQA